MRDRLFLVPLLLGGLTGCQSFKKRLFSPLTTRLDLVNSQLGETNRQLGMVNHHLGTVTVTFRRRGKDSSDARGVGPAYLRCQYYRCCSIRLTMRSRMRWYASSLCDRIATGSATAIYPNPFSVAICDRYTGAERSTPPTRRQSLPSRRRG